MGSASFSICLAIILVNTIKVEGSTRRLSAGDFQINRKRLLLSTIDGTWTQWTNWGSCSAICGFGVSYRTRTCSFDPAAPRGKNCTGTAMDIQSCKLAACSADGEWGQWKSWGACSTTCDTGTRMRFRDCQFNSTLPRGKQCRGTDQETDICMDAACPVDGEWGQWKSWGACSTTCDTGARMRLRDCQFNSTLPRGKKCRGTDQETDICMDAACPVDGVWTQWTNWGGCSVTCGSGQSSRTRTCSYPNLLAPHGKNCTGTALNTQPCQSGECPVHGVWQPWGTWSRCSQSCGGGYQLRRRTCYFPTHVIQRDYCSGRGTDTKPCANTTCPTVHGVWQPWGTWSRCSQSCGGGFQLRRRTCYFPTHVIQRDYCSGRGTDTKPCANTTCPTAK